MTNYDTLDKGYKGIFDITLEDMIGSGTIREQCLSAVVTHYLQQLKRYTENIYIYSCIENLPDHILDYLAIEFDLPYYEDSLNRDTKIRLLKEGFNWRRTAGTVAGVETLAQKMFGEGRVTEWYEYGGDPGKFKITTNAPLVEDMEEFFRVLLRKEKNVKSWLEYIEIIRDVSGAVSMGGFIHQRYSCNTIGCEPLD